MSSFACMNAEAARSTAVKTISKGSPLDFGISNPRTFVLRQEERLTDKTTDEELNKS